jgi:predicted CopG family antitoxin
MKTVTLSDEVYEFLLGLLDSQDEMADDADEILRVRAIEELETAGEP